MKYNAEKIKVLKGLDPVRLRPGMYIGSTGSRGLHHLVDEIIDNSVDEYLTGFCDEIIVILNKDGSVTVRDNGRGIPIDKHETGQSALRVIMTTLHAGGKFDTESNSISGGLHGVGAAVVNALSEYFYVKVFFDKKIYEDKYERGEPLVKLKNGELKPIANTNRQGTEITFLPDIEIFKDIEFNPEIIKARLKELSYLNNGLKLIFKDDIRDEEEIFQSDQGLKSFIEDINEDKKPITEIIILQGSSGHVEVDLAFQYVKDNSENIISFTNNINTHEGGSHVAGLRASLTRLINNYTKELNLLNKKDNNLEGRDVRNGLVAVLSLRYPNPEFEGQTKTRLGNPEARGIVDEIVYLKSQLYFDRNINTLEKIIENAKESKKLRKAEEKIRDNFLNKQTTLSVQSKLASARLRDPKKLELFIVEGDSAGGSAKQARNRDYQAILPLKGKILNVERRSLNRILDNQEIISLISALGTGIGPDFDIEKLKYNKIIMMTDADVDGSHITTLLLTFFYRYMRELIDKGHIYIAMPPLYRGEWRKEERYFYDDMELEEFLKDNTLTNIQRYKGLGEMNPEQLWKTTLDPKTRLLKQVVIDNFLEADKTTKKLMGSRVAPRRKFIEENANYAELDI